MPHNNPLRQDPTRTTTLRRRFIADMNRRMRALKADIFELIVTLDVFGLKAPGSSSAQAVTTLQTNVEAREWQFLTDDRKLERFNMWFAERVSQQLLEVDVTGEPWTSQYVDSAYRKGVNRAFTDTNRVGLLDRPEFFEGTKQEFLNQAFNSPETVSKLRLLGTRTFEDLKGMTAGMASDMSRILSDGLAAGLSPSQMARELTSRIDTISRTRAATIARTEIIHAHSEGQLDAFERLGVKKLGAIVEWSTAGDARVCPRCAQLEGRTFTIKAARGMIPLHPNCVLGDTIVISPDCNAILKGYYTGEVINFITTNGFNLTVTPNHILLTEHGFVPAKLISEGFNLFVNNFRDHGISAPNDYGNMATIADVFKTFTKPGNMAPVSMEVTPKDLHNEGGSYNGDIEIVNIKSILGNTCETHLLEAVDNLLFPSSTDFPLTLHALSSFSSILLSASHSFDGGMGICRDPLALFLGHILHAYYHRFATSSSGKPSVLHTPIDNISADPILLRKCLDAHPLFKQLDDSVRGDLATKGLSAIETLDSRLIEMTLKRFSSDSVVLPDLVNCNALDGMHLDSVLKIKSSHVVDTPVYDVETKSTLYFANGVLSSNCRCTWIPAEHALINNASHGRKRKRKKKKVDNASHRPKKKKKKKK